MQVSDDRLILAGEVVESRMTKGFLYLKDELGSANYPGALNLMGIKWPIGQRVRITIEVESADPTVQPPKESTASASQDTSTDSVGANIR